MWSRKHCSTILGDRHYGRLAFRMSDGHSLGPTMTPKKTSRSAIGHSHRSTSHFEGFEVESLDCLSLQFMNRRLSSNRALPDSTSCLIVHRAIAHLGPRRPHLPATSSFLDSAARPVFDHAGSVGRILSCLKRGSAFDFHR